MVAFEDVASSFHSDSNALQRATAHLPPGQRAALALHYFEEQSAAFAGMQAGVAMLPNSAGLDGGALMLRANSIWAAVHGVAVLAIDENLKLVDPEAVLGALLDQLLN